MGLIQTSFLYMSTLYVCMHFPHLLHLFTLPISSTLSSSLHSLTLTPHSSNPHLTLPYTHPSYSLLTFHPHTPHTLTPHTPHTLTPHTSCFLYFILSLTSLLTLPTLTLTSLHSPSITPHTPHIDTENVFCLMVWVLDDRQKKQLHPLTPFHSHIEQG